MSGDIDWGIIGGQLSLGVLLGLAIGFLAKKTLKILLILLGVLVLTGVALERMDVITIHWGNIEASYNAFLASSGGIGVMLQRWVTNFGGLIPVAGSFVVGFALGLKLG